MQNGVRKWQSRSKASPAPLCPLKPIVKANNNKLMKFGFEFTIVLCLVRCTHSKDRQTSEHDHQSCTIFKHQATNFFLTGVEGSMHHGISTLVPELYKVAFQQSANEPSEECCHVEWTSYPSKVILLAIYYKT